MYKDCPLREADALLRRLISTQNYCVILVRLLFVFVRRIGYAINAFVAVVVAVEVC